MNRQYGALSGIAIALIVLNHSIFFGLQLSAVDGDWLKPLIFLQALGAFAVPAFLFISGAFVSYSASQLSLTFVRSSLSRILWPYLLWSGLFYLLVFVTTQEHDSAPGYVRNLVVGYPYHFVPLLAFWYITSPLLVAIARRHPLWLLSSVAAYQILLILVRFPEISGTDTLAHWIGALIPPVLFSTFAEWGVYFPLGLVVGLHEARIKPRLKQWRWGIAVLAAGLFLVGMLNAFDVVWAPWARLVAPLPLMLLLPVIPRASIPLPAKLEFLGRESYGIYLSHFVMLALLAAWAPGRSITQFPLLVLPTFLAAAIFVPLGVMAAAARIPATRVIYRYLFGTTPPARLSPRHIERPQAPVLPGAARHVQRPT